MSSARSLVAAERNAHLAALRRDRHRARAARDRLSHVVPRADRRAIDRPNGVAALELRQLRRARRGASRADHRPRIDDCP